MPMTISTMIAIIASRNVTGNAAAISLQTVLPEKLSPRFPSDKVAQVLHVLHR